MLSFFSLNIFMIFIPFLFFLYWRGKERKETAKEKKENTLFVVGFGGVNRLRALSKITQNHSVSLRSKKCCIIIFNNKKRQHNNKMCYYFRMNVIIIGNCSEEFVNLIKKSKLLDKLYVINNNFNTDLPSIKYQTLEELVQKLKALQTDVVIVTDKEFIIDGSVEHLKSNFINVLSPNQKWFNLEKSRLIEIGRASCRERV